MRAAPLAVLEGPDIRAIIRPVGAQLWQPAFRLDGGRWVRPLAEAPWAGEMSNDPDLPGHLANLGGEFFCLPFGGNSAITDPAPGWEGAQSGGGPDPMHGPTANLPWRLLSATPTAALAALDLPGLSLRRRISLEGKRTIRVEVELDASHPMRVPVAFHPILALPDRPGALQLSARFAEAGTYPGGLGPGERRLTPNRRFADLAQAPGLNGPVDLTQLPTGGAVDDVVLLLRCCPPVTVRNGEAGYAVSIDWDPRLPHCMLWLHDRGLDDPPWNGRFRGLGIEPVAAAFDLPEAVSAGPNPLAASGYPTALDLPRGRTALWLTLSVSG